jgi:hypothetical protein
MKKISALLGLILLLFFSRSSLALANSSVDQDEQLFQQKAQLVLKTLAEKPTIPQDGDIEKYAWPAVIARLHQNPNDPLAHKILQIFTKRKKDSFYTNRDAFGSPGITRLFYLYDRKTDLKLFEDNYLKFLLTPSPQKGHYNFWQSGGTENFVNMLRTSGYLLAKRAIWAQLPGAENRSQEMKLWILKKSKKTYRMGVAEWDSSTYTPFNLIGWLNLYDFAKDPKIKQAARAVLDYYACTMALKYTFGIYGGAEQRGGGATQSFNTTADYLGWLWFDEKIPQNKSFFTWPTYIQTVHAATSSYRPPKEAIALARKRFNHTSSYRNTKANYFLDKLNIPEFFEIGKTYTLGTALTEQGDQIINWKLVSYPQKGSTAQTVFGGNSIYAGAKNGAGKTIYDKYVQTQNILVQMTYIPTAIKAKFNRQLLRKNLASLISKIPCGNSCKYVLTRKLEAFIPVETYPINNINEAFPTRNYIAFPKNLETVIKSGRYFIRLNQTYLAIVPFPNFKASRLVHSPDAADYIETQADLGQMAGFIVEVGNAFEQKSFENFQNLILQKTRLDLNQIKSGKITYKDIKGSLLAIDYQFPSPFPRWTINNQAVVLNAPNNWLYNGNELRVKNEVLRIQGDKSVYEVDYRGETPIFKRSHF